MHSTCILWSSILVIYMSTSSVTWLLCHVKDWNIPVFWWLTWVFLLPQEHCVTDWNTPGFQWFTCQLLLSKEYFCPVSSRRALCAHGGQQKSTMMEYNHHGLSPVVIDLISTSATSDSSSIDWDFDSFELGTDQHHGIIFVRDKAIMIGIMHGGTKLTTTTTFENIFELDPCLSSDQWCHTKRAVCPSTITVLSCGSLATAMVDRSLHSHVDTAWALIHQLCHQLLAAK